MASGYKQLLPPIKHKISEAEGSEDATLHELEEEGVEDEKRP